MQEKTCNLSFFLYKLHVFSESHLYAENYIHFCNYYMFGVSSVMRGGGGSHLLAIR